MQGFVHFIAKNYLWPETGTGGLTVPGGWKCEMHTLEGVENLAGGSTPTYSLPSTRAVSVVSTLSDRRTYITAAILE